MTDASVTSVSAVIEKAQVKCSHTSLFSSKKCLWRKKKILDIISIHCPVNTNYTNANSTSASTMSSYKSLLDLISSKAAGEQP